MQGIKPQSSDEYAMVSYNHIVEGVFPNSQLRPYRNCLLLREKKP